MKIDYKQKLDTLRYEILDLIDQADYTDFGFAGRRSLKTHGEVYDWIKDVAEKIVERLDDDQKIKPSQLGDRRSRCPLCNQGPRSTLMSHEGFAIPEGLRRHLLGTYSSHQCLFMRVAKEMALAEIND